MRKAMVPLAVILSVMTILLAAVWMRYARDIRELETRVDSSVVYDRHYIMIAQDNSRMWQTIYESARDTAAGESGPDGAGRTSIRPRTVCRLP